MNNEDKILSMLEVLTTDMAELKTDMAKVKADVAELKTDMEEVKEKLTIVHGSMEHLIEWADHVGVATGVTVASVSAAREP